MWRRISKQLLYGALYLALWAAFGFLIYFLFIKPSPSCFDNVQNQGEEGIDCGGPCKTECLPQSLRPLTATGGVLVLPIDAGHVSILASIANPNQTEAAQSFRYVFTLSQADGTKIITVSGTSYVYTGEVKYIALPNIAVDALPAHADLTIQDPSWVTTAEFQKPNLTIQNFTATMSPLGSIEVDGRIVNQDVIPLSNVTVIAIFYGPLGTPVGVSETRLASLNVNESLAFTILHPALSGVNLTATKIFTYTYRP